jgi:hypothetical protein
MVRPDRKQEQTYEKIQSEKIWRGPMKPCGQLDFIQKRNETPIEVSCIHSTRAYCVSNMASTMPNAEEEEV